MTRRLHRFEKALEGASPLAVGDHVGMAPGERKAGARAALAGLLPGILGLAVSSCGSAGEEPQPGGPGAASTGDYRATKTHVLLRGDRNRRDGVTGGFGEELGFVDFVYRLGAAGDTVPEAQIEGLLAEHAGQIGLTGDHRAALRRVLSERSAFAAWKQFLADGGRVQPFAPVKREDLPEIPPSRLVLMGEGRYMSDRLLIVSRSDETAMEPFLFHEIQHYILDKWDSPLFEAGESTDADHEIIAMVDERRRIVETFRAGRIPMDSRSERVLHDVAGAATESLRAGRWAELVERAQSHAFYRAWVAATLQRALARNETNRRIRIVSMQLSDGTALVLDERSDRDAPDAVTVGNLRVPPHFRLGPAIYVSLGEIRRFDADRLFSEGHVPESDRPAVSEFVLAHGRDRRKGRGHIFSDPELQDLAHLSAYNAAIFQQALRLAGAIRSGTEHGLEETMKEDRYQTALSVFLRRYADRMAAGPATDPRSPAAEIADDVVRRRSPRAE